MDLHDSTSQDLVALATMLGQLRTSIPSSSNATPEAKDAALEAAASGWLSRVPGPTKRLWPRACRSLRPGGHGHPIEPIIFPLAWSNSRAVFDVISRRRDLLCPTRGRPQAPSTV